MAFPRAFSLLLVAAFLVVATANAETKPPATFKTFSDAITAASDSPVSTFIAAVKAANVAGSLMPGTKWTILAPTNEAFGAKLKAATGLTPADLLKPENKALLVKVLSLHVIPSGAVTSSELKGGEKVATALKGAAPLMVKLAGKKVEFEGPLNTATVVTPDIQVGNSVVHVIDTVLLPAGAAKAEKAKKNAEKVMSSGRRLI